jgi:hypothetical protein
MELCLYRHCFDNTGSPESVCENFTELNDPASGEPMRKIFIAKVTNDTNQGTPSKGDPCDFPFFRNIGVPLMATLYIPELNVGLPVWLGTIPNVLNSLDDPNLSTLCHGNHVDVPSSKKSSPPPSSAPGEHTVTSSRKSKQNKKRNNKKKEEIGRQPLQVTLKTTTQPLQVMLGEKVQLLLVILEIGL